MSHIDPSVSSGSSPGKRARTDFLISADSFPATIFLVTPLSRLAHAWVAEHIPDDALWFAGGIIVEHRFVAALVAGIERSGLRVSRE